MIDEQSSLHMNCAGCLKYCCRFTKPRISLKYSTRPYKLVGMMILDKIEKLLSDINKSLHQNDERDFATLISDKSSVISNFNFHRYEIFHQKVVNIKFYSSSFRGTFMEQNVFINCEFLNCAFVTTIINNTQFKIANLSTACSGLYLATQVQAAFIESHPNPQIFTAKSNTQINQKSSLQLLSHKKTS
ncbi:hypothetical protein QGZ99_07730 [Kingella kingae]|uniref:hypothetical protein n=1 Tax=Kingella kingae TaxID=504 RepID=UPI001E367355|nr:hypothetical protein [Kingella kingae]MDK4534974.1 hypothetical protein [Kingella kingae]MDK4541465.1 hypothetical protein [Kingella kingae]MDK4553998.1 hypothetical protein [Kingella kingae]